MKPRDSNYYTLALMGFFNPVEPLFGYLNKLAVQLHDSGQGFCVLMRLHTENQNVIARHILKQKRIFHDLRLEVVVTGKEWMTSHIGCKSKVGRDRNIIIGRADQYHLLKETRRDAVTDELLKFFADQADKILYALRREGRKDANRLHYFHRKPEIEYFRPHIRLDEPRDVRSERLLARSIDFIRGNRFHAPSNLIPDDLLKEWITDNPHIYAPYFGCLDATADMLRMTDREGQFLPLKVFAYIYAFYNDFWAFRFLNPEDAERRFGQFQILLRRIVALRKSGYEMSYLDMCNIAGYDAALEQSQWVMITTKMSG